MRNSLVLTGVLTVVLAVFAVIALRADTTSSVQARDKTTTQTVKLQTKTESLADEIEYVPPYIALALKAGTLGPGVELTFGVVKDALNIRLGGNYLPLKFSGIIKDVDYSMDVTWASVPLALDWYPFFNNFRITGAVMYNRNRVCLNANLNEEQKIGDHEYTPEEIGTLSGGVDFRNIAPYIGIGFGNAVGGPDTSWNFVFDVGVMFQGVPEINLSANGSMSGNPVFQYDLDQEQDGIQDAADKFQFYPVVSAGVSYQF